MGHFLQGYLDLRARLLLLLKQKIRVDDVGRGLLDGCYLELGAVYVPFAATSSTLRHIAAVWWAFLHWYPGEDAPFAHL